MKASLKCVPAALLVIFGFVPLATNVQAQDEATTFVYTNDNNDGPDNTVSAFRVGPGGTLTMILGSPFKTGGRGIGVGFFASHRMTSATISRNFLYVSNDGTNDISAFSIDPRIGSLTLLGPPVPTGGTGSAGISLAVTPNGKFLYAGNSLSQNLSTFRILENGTLMRIGSTVAVGDQPDGIIVSPNGKFLAVAAFLSNSVVMFTADATTGALGFVGAFSQGGDLTNTSDVDINCHSNLLFAAHETFGRPTTVSVATINPKTGDLSQISNSPFTFDGKDSNVGVLSPDNRHLFVSNQVSNSILSLDVGSGGSLSQEAAPFANPNPLGVPSGMATNVEGTLLYVANFFKAVTGFRIDGDGGLSPIGSFTTGGTGTGLLESLSVFPSKPVEGEGDEFGDDGHKGHFRFETERACGTRGEMEFEEPDTGEGMTGSVDALTVSGATALISGTGTLLGGGTPLHYTAVVLGNQPLIGLDHFAISWVTSTGSVFQTSGTLANGYILVHTQ